MSSLVSRCAPLCYILTKKTGCRLCFQLAVWVHPSTVPGIILCTVAMRLHALLTSSIVMSCPCPWFTPKAYVRLHHGCSNSTRHVLAVICHTELGFVPMPSFWCCGRSDPAQCSWSVLAACCRVSPQTQPSIKPCPPFSTGIPGHVGDVCVYMRCVSLSGILAVCVHQ